MWPGETAERLSALVFRTMMKLLFSSSDPADVKHISTKLVAAGIPCAVRSAPQNPSMPLAGCYPELWVQNEDFRTAIVIFTSAVLREAEWGRLR
jgi:hypothetical protein